MPTPSEATPPTERQVLVVGGSVAGLATAAFLHADGLSPVVVTSPDSVRAAPTDDGPSDTPVSDPPRNVVLWRFALELLAELGVAAPLRASGASVRRWRLHHDTDGAGERLASARGGDDPAVVVDHDRLRRRLREPLSSQHVRLSKTPRRLASTDHGLGVEFADGVRERFDAVVGADGVRSWVRQARPGTATPTPWGTAEWPVSTDGPGPEGTVVDVWTRAAMFTAYPNGDGLLVTPTTNGGTAARRRAAATARLRALLDAVDAVDGSDVTLGSRRDHRGLPSDQWTRGRIGFVGPAARSLPPTFSLGPSLTVEAAGILAAELARSDDVAGALRRYARRRLARLRALDRRLSFRRAPSRETNEPSPVRTARSLRTTVLRSFFTEREPAVSAVVDDR